MSDPALSIGIGGLAGTAETRWIRLEQVGRPDQAITYAEAADLVDSLYSVSPCDNNGDPGTGGEAADEDAVIPEEEFLTRATARLGVSSCDEDCVAWPVEVDVLRSHQEGAWNLVSETAEIGASVTMTGRKHETVELSGAVSHDLEYPYSGDLRVAGAQVASVKGSTVNFTRPVSGWVRISYTAIWDRVSVQVPVHADESGVYRADAAALLCFWSRLAAALTLEQPEDDSTLDALREVCPRYRYAPKDKERHCYESVEHYSRCRCSGRETDGGWHETVSVSCPDGKSSQAVVGRRRVLDGYVDCPDEKDEELASREFYKKTCCEYPQPRRGTLPTCRKTYEKYNGGAEIEGGAASWRERYGADVQLTAVSPEDGCGEIITEWHVDRKNCCDDVIPMTPRPENPTEMEPGHSYNIGVRDGRPDDISWELRGGLEFLDGTTSRHGPGLYGAIVRARESICPQPKIIVDDGCYPLTMVFVGGDSEPLSLSEEDMAIFPGATFTLQATGGVPPYMWIVGEGIILEGWSADGSIALLRALGRDEWCMADITVSDQCGQSATCTVRNASTGVWANFPWNDGCASPIGGALFPTDPNAGSNSFSLPLRGYRVRTSATDHWSCNYTPSARTCSPGTWFTSGGVTLFRQQCSRWGGDPDEAIQTGCCRNSGTDRPIVARGEHISAVKKWICNG